MEQQQKKLLQSQLNEYFTQTMNLTTKEKNYIYNLAAKKCQMGDFKSATPLFQLLVSIEGKNSLYLKALAGCHQQQKDYLGAYALYNYAYLLDMKQNADCLFYIANCLIELEEWKKAEATLQNVLTELTDEKILARTKLLIKTVEAKLAETTVAAEEIA